jgi:exopolyphosphatase/guanosine-5'-triphosphate,3'-diphosphate pyrophosphatase
MNDSEPAREQQPERTVAAIDLGSNSFHMIVARIGAGQLQVIDRLREMVRLREGLTRDRQLDPAVARRALDCLGRFGQRLGPLAHGDVKAVGTNTLRQVKDGGRFLRAAQAALGHPIEVIAGREEARLIYLGVAHGLAAGNESRLVVDIGGGSTELIVGEGFESRQRESTEMGCVSISQRYFADGQISARAMDKAILACSLELRPVKAWFRDAGWTQAVGSSGTIKAIREVVAEAGWSNVGITLDSLVKLKDALVGAGSLEKLNLKGLSDERKPVFPGGFAVLFSVFQNIGIERMDVSDEALREGLIYDMMGRSRHEDVRDRTVASLVRRFGTDTEQARRVEETALDLFGQVAEAWGLADPRYPAMLSWAAQLHEIGLSVAHGQFHKHGAYLLENADLSGFTRQEQQVLAALVRGQRRRFPVALFEQLPEELVLCAKQIGVLLRLAVLLHRSRSPAGRPDVRLRVENGRLQLAFPEGWLAAHPLSRAELKKEARYLKEAGFKLKYA